MQAFVLLCIISISSASLSQNVPIEEKWAECSIEYEKYSWPLKDTLIDLLNNLTSDTSIQISKQCRTSLSTYARDLKLRKLWAFEMMDSSAKMRPGVFSSRYVDFGHYQQCLGTKHEGNEFVGQYSLLRINWPLPERQIPPSALKLNSNGTWIQDLTEHYELFYFETFITSICYPSTCSEGDLRKVLDTAQTSLNFEILTRETEADTNPSITAYPISKIIPILIFLSLFGITHLSTTLCYYFDAAKLPRIVQHFNAISTWDKLVSDEQSESSRRLAFLNGLRIFYLMSAICCHFFMPISPRLFALYMPLPEYSQGSKIFDGFFKTSASAVAINFVIGGALCYYTWFKFLLKTHGKVSFIQYFTVRFLRTLPVLMGCILLVVGFPVAFGSGPLYNMNLKNISENCLQFSWAEVAGVSNFMLPGEICMPHAWYLSVDLQLYAASFLIVMLMYHYPAHGFVTAILVAIASMIIKAIQLEINGGPAFIDGSMDIRTTVDWVPQTLFSTFNHVPSYMIGLLLGHFLIKDFKIAPKLVPLVWFIMATSTQVMMFLTVIALSMPFELPQEVTSLPVVGIIAHHISAITNNELPHWLFIWIGSTFKATLSFYFAVFCYLCYNETRDLDRRTHLFLNDAIRLVVKFLSAKIFTVLGKMSYPIFMAHYLVIVYMMSTVSDPVPLDVREMLLRAPFVFFISILVGAILHFTIEAPFNNIMKSVLGLEKKTSVVDINNNRLDGKKTK